MTERILIHIGCGFTAGQSWRNFAVSPTLVCERLPLVDRLYTRNNQRFLATCAMATSHATHDFMAGELQAAGFTAIRPYRMGDWTDVRNWSKLKIPAAMKAPMARNWRWRPGGPTNG